MVYWLALGSSRRSLERREGSVRGGGFSANGQYGDTKVREDGIVDCCCSKPTTQVAYRRSSVARDNRCRKGARHPGLGTQRRGGLSQDSGYLPA
jgi:hypothetical protein